MESSVPVFPLSVAAVDQSKFRPASAIDTADWSGDFISAYGVCGLVARTRIFYVLVECLGCVYEHNDRGWYLRVANGADVFGGCSVSDHFISRCTLQYRSSDLGDAVVYISSDDQRRICKIEWKSDVD